MELLLTAIAAIAVSGLPGAILSRNSPVGQWVATLFVAAGSLLGALGTLNWLRRGGPLETSYHWAVMPQGALEVHLHVGVDGISALFLLPILLIGLLGSIYGLGYWKQSEHAGNGRSLRVFYGLCVAGMSLVVLARDSVVFLVGWEVMALSAFFLVATEDEEEGAREAGWIYLALTHTATLILFAMFALLWTATDSGELVPKPDASPIPVGMATTIFILALAGFGIKAGLMPLHIWLPSAHANAPSHVSALMSGVMIKMGIYGLVRISSFFPQAPVWWGALVLALGAVSGILGVAYAIGQHDLKRLLAYHSIENIGIIVMGLGLALLGRSRLARPDWVVLGLGGALLHVWNHALFKSLLFYSAGSVIHAVRTREMDELGGLFVRMPYTACCFLAGAVAICGLPPLNGFVSEFLIYNGLFRTLGIPEAHRAWPAAALAAPGLALIGALAAACFIKAFGTVFLGAGRSEHARHAHEAPRSMVVPMLLLVGCCTAIGFAPGAVAPALDGAVAAWAAPAGGVDLTQARQVYQVYPLTQWRALGFIADMAIALAAALAAGAALLWLRLRGGSVESSVTWGCGYSSPTPRMQYTSSSFAEMLVNQFHWALWPVTRPPRIDAVFPREADFESDVPEGVLERLVVPATRWLAQRLSWFRVFQQGSVQAYILYIFVILILLLIWP